MSQPTIAIIGAGRMGQGLGLALARAGRNPMLLSRRAHHVIPPLRLEADDWTAAVRGARVVLCATPDSAIPEVAARLAHEGAVGAEHIVLHLSGRLDRSALAPLAASGAALGSFHPLQTIASAETAPARLTGSFVGLEGDERALVEGHRLARLLGMIAVELPTGSKPAYHAGAAMVANYTVALMGLAEQVARRAGVAEDVADKIYLPLLAGALENLRRLSPAEALTGPVRRGDAETVAAHLAALQPEEQEVYRALGRVALALARSAGLEPARAEAVERLLY